MIPLEKGDIVWVTAYDPLMQSWEQPLKRAYDPLHINLHTEYFPEEKDAWEFYRNDLYDRQKDINRLVVEATKKLKTLEN